MTTPEEETLKDLREKNNELVQKVQYWKMTAAQRENEKLELMKEINELRLKLSRMRSGGAAQARKLEIALQAESQEAISHLVQASDAVIRTIELAKTYVRDRQELDKESPRWSNISGTSNTERVHRVPPMMMGGQSIQPVVSLSRALLNTSNPRAPSRSPHQNSITERAVPMHMLQDVYIPLTRIDVNELPGNNVETDEANAEDGTEDLTLEDSERSQEESQNITEDFDASRRLDAVTEDLEPEDEVATPPPRSRTENPLEGPSWLLDAPTSSKTSGGRTTLEPDSTTELEESTRVTPPAPSPPAEHTEALVPAARASVARVSVARAAVEEACVFSPTVRRRKRTSSPPPTPMHFSPRRPSTSGRVLKVMVAKMRLDSSGDDSSEGSSPPKRGARGTPPPAARLRFDAPSPNGATDAALIVSEAIEDGGGGDAGESHSTSATSRSESVASRDSRDSDDHAEGRTRRPRKPITYKEKPLNSESVASRESRDSADHPEGRTRRPRKPITYKEKPLNRKMRR